MGALLILAFWGAAAGVLWVVVWAGVLRPWLAIALWILAAIFFLVGILSLARRNLAPALGLTRGWPYVLAVAGAALAAGLLVAGTAGLIGPGTPAPPSGITDPTDPAQRTAVVAYARSLDYDSGGTHHGVMDEQFLTVAIHIDTLRARGLLQRLVIGNPFPPPQVVDTARGRSDTLFVFRGPLARVLPERRSHLNAPSALARGRIVTRVWIDPAYRDPVGRAGYPKLGLRPGVNYVWIDGLGASRDTSGRAVIIPDSAAFATQRADTTFVIRHPHGVGLWQRIFGRGHRWNKATARWMHDPLDDFQWDTCDKHGCCDTGGDDE